MDTPNTVIESCVTDIAASQLGDVGELCRANLHVREDKMSKRVAASYEKTRELAFGAFSCKGMYAGFPVERSGGGELRIGGVAFADEVLAEALSGAVEAVAFGVAAHGYEDLCDRPGSTDFDVMFYSGWGTGFSTRSQQWIERAIRGKAHERGLYTGKSWCPGEEGTGLSLQRQLFELLDFSQIGLTLRDGLDMRPIMSVTGLVGVFDDEGVELQKSTWMV